MICLQWFGEAISPSSSWIRHCLAFVSSTLLRLHINVASANPHSSQSSAFTNIVSPAHHECVIDRSVVSTRPLLRYSAIVRRRPWLFIHVRPGSQLRRGWLEGADRLVNIDFVNWVNLLCQLAGFLLTIVPTTSDLCPNIDWMETRRHCYSLPAIHSIEIMQCFLLYNYIRFLGIIFSSIL